MVALFGPDGAGKSTQARLLTTYLGFRGNRVKMAWVRSLHTFSFIVWNIFRKAGLCYNRSTIPMPSISRPAVSYLLEESYGAISPISMMPPVLKGKISRSIWSLIEFVSVVPILLLQVYLPLLLGYYIVAERYVVDSVVTIAYFLNDPNFAESFLARVLLVLVPKDTVFVYIDANYETILERRRNLAGPLEYTEFHRQLYRKLTPIIGAIYIDTSSQDVLETQQFMINAILDRAV